MLIWNERRRLQRDSRNPGLSAAREAARPRLRKASACSGKSTIKFNRAYILIVKELLFNRNVVFFKPYMNLP
ncbi:MAG: hypothetical protein ACE3JN_06285 [Ectobacillus sp.]